MKGPLFAAVLIVTMSACSKKDDPTKNALLTINIDRDFPNSTSKQWVFISDKAGSVLQTLEITDSPQVFFTATTPDDSLTVTLVENIDYLNGGSYMTLNTYSGILPHSVLTFNQRLSLYDSYNISANVFVTGFTLIRENMPLVASNGEHTVNLVVGENNVYTGNLKRLAPSFDVLISGYTPDYVPVYLKAGPTTGDDIHADFSDFKPFEKKFVLPPVDYIYGTLFGYDDVKPGFSGYQLSQFEFEYTQTNPCYVGYLDGYASYGQDFTVFREVAGKTYTVNYAKKGLLNIAPEFPPFEYSVVTSTPAAATVTATGDYTYKTSIYGFNETTNSIAWFIYSPDGPAPQFKELPAELTQKFPDLKLEKFHYEYSNFAHYVDGTSYNVAINNMLQGIQAETYELYYFQKFE